MSPQPCPPACVIKGSKHPQQSTPHTSIISCSYPFFPWNGTLPVHEVHCAVRVLCWDSNKTLRENHVQAHQRHGSSCQVLTGPTLYLPLPESTGLANRDRQQGPIHRDWAASSSEKMIHCATHRNKAFLTNGWSFLQAFLSWASLLRAIPDIVKVLQDTAEV